MWAELQAERLAGMTIFATALHDRGHLRNDVTIDNARDTLWTYNSAELYQLLVIERGWTPEHYGQWVAAALTAASCNPTVRRTGAGWQRPFSSSLAARQRRSACRIATSPSVRTTKASKPASTSQ